MRYIYMFLLLFNIIIYTGCQIKSTNIYEITDKYFFIQIDNIKLNFDTYKDYTIKITGMYGSFTNSDGTLCGPGVYQIGPGCCDNDSGAYFLTVFPDEEPPMDCWVEIIGTLSINDSEEIILQVQSYSIIDQNGFAYLYEGF